MACGPPMTAWPRRPHMVQHNPIVADRKVAALRQAMGPVIAQALADRLVVEVMVNPDGKIWIDRIGEGRSFTGEVLAPADADRILRLLADHVGEVVTRDRPRMSATLAGDRRTLSGRLHARGVKPRLRHPQAARGGLHARRLCGARNLSPAMADVLRAAAAGRQNLLIAGGTGSGKTTLANAILAEPAFAADRVVIIEDTAELQCSAADKLEMLTKRTEPTVTMTDLVRDTLRLRPDRIIIGEVRDGSALDLLKAWNTGHPGGLATIHANSAGEALTRLEDLIGEVTQRVPYRAIAQAINLVVFIERTATGRRVRSVTRVLGLLADGYQLEDVL